MKRRNNHAKNKSNAHKANVASSNENKPSSNPPESATPSGSMENPKFKDACEHIKMNVDRFIRNGYDYVSSSEDELENSEDIQRTFMKYDVDCLADSQKFCEMLKQSLSAGAVTCLICIGSVKRADPIWSCDLCYCVFHVPCIQKWAKDSMFHRANNAQPNDAPKERTWCCPQCRHEYSSAVAPCKYFCFCQKVEDPVLDPWILPHSCGQICKKTKRLNCEHSCLMLCHPGPCPPCAVSVEVTCFCSKSPPQSMRCCQKMWSCGKQCGKLLLCNQHYCEEPCHTGECKPCLLQSQQSCKCGSEKSVRPCSDRIWKCEKKCSKPLDCGNHVCEIICHDENCAPCPKSGPRTCPCTKKVESLPCTEEIVPCGDTCEKMLQCGVHQCAERCHFGECGNCLQMRLMKCRCGANEKSVPCCKEFLCDNKCKNKRDCGKHNCNRKCCVGNCPPCESPCGKTLTCGSHKCQSRCHPGPCFPCQESAVIKCFCGATQFSVPCCIKRTAPPPPCQIDCKLPADCHHEQRHKHHCHFGKCPPCRTICGKSRECGHPCPLKCHTAVLTKVEAKKKTEGPWDLKNAFKMELIDKPCPLCIVPVAFTCLGKHVTHDFPCHEAKPWSCGRICGRHLLCDNHVCEEQCHNVVQSVNSNTQSKQCLPCTRPCGKERPSGCVHMCRKVCHPGPCDPCREMVKVQCHCSITTLYIDCCRWTVADEHQMEELKCCQNTCPKLITCGHRCPKLCHTGPCADVSACKKKRVVRCVCKRIKKEVPCVTKMEKLECNEECLANLEKQRLEEIALQEKKARQEQCQREQELEEFKRRMEGKKKKVKKGPKQVVVEEHFLKKYWFYLTLSVFISILVPVINYAM